MKLSFDIKKKELSLHADVEKLVDKQLDKKTARPTSNFPLDFNGRSTAGF